MVNLEKEVECLIEDCEKQQREGSLYYASIQYHYLNGVYEGLMYNEPENNRNGDNITYNNKKALIKKLREFLYEHV